MVNHWSVVSDFETDRIPSNPGRNQIRQSYHQKKCPPTSSLRLRTKTTHIGVLVFRRISEAILKIALLHGACEMRWMRAAEKYLNRSISPAELEISQIGKYYSGWECSGHTNLCELEKHITFPATARGLYFNSPSFATDSRHLRKLLHDLDCDIWASQLPAIRTGLIYLVGDGLEAYLYDIRLVIPEFERLAEVFGFFAKSAAAMIDPGPNRIGLWVG